MFRSSVLLYVYIASILSVIPENSYVLSIIATKWATNSPGWTDEMLALLSKTQTGRRPNLTLDDFIQKSDAFPIPFHIQTTRCKHLKSKVPVQTLERNINSVYQLITERTLHLYVRFLLYKQQHGSAIERQVYKDMSLEDFITRLMLLKAVYFFGKRDKFMLLSGEKGYAEHQWETIGTNRERSPLILHKCLSYDEISLTALMSVSSFTVFINDGRRSNRAVEDPNPDNFQSEGVITGLIGPRLLNNNPALEHKEIIITREQNTQQNGYGKAASMRAVMADLYEEPAFTYDQLQQIKDQASYRNRFTEIERGVFFDNVVYAKRLSISFDTLLIEANSRAHRLNKFAYVHIVGLGLGKWQISEHQKQIFVDTFCERVRALGSYLHYISDLHFSYIDVTTVGNVSDNGQIPIPSHPLNEIIIHISNREPHSKLTGEHADKLLVDSYAWDGNALPGNEVWDGQLDATSDSSTACSTEVMEIHNPHINMVLIAANLKIATPDKGLVALQDYKPMRSSHTTSSTTTVTTTPSGFIGQSLVILSSAYESIKTFISWIIHHVKRLFGF